jgi:hypothetical protein
MAAAVRRQYAIEPRVRYVNLGELIDLGDPSLSYDQMHLTASGNQRVGTALMAPVLEMAAARAR